MARVFGRLRARLLVVNLVVLLVPVAGLEFARIYERQLLASLERDMRNQASLVRALVESDLAEGRALDAPSHAQVLVAAATRTRTRVRLLDARGRVVVDSHADGPPEGPEPPAPSFLSSSAYEVGARVRWSASSDVEGIARGALEDRWPDVADRREVRSALAGSPDAFTRIRERGPSVLLFLSEPIRHRGEVVGVVYVTRSTQPVMVELYRIRRGLIQVLVVSVLFSLLLTGVLAWSISRPITRLARAARRIARGDRGVAVPVGGSGEVRELGEAFAIMTRELDAKLRYIGELSADVAHELKSPLTSIRGAAELLQEGAADDPEARARFLSNIRLDVDRLDRLVNRLLELSRIEGSQEAMEDLDLAALLARVVARTNTAEQPVSVVWETTRRRVRGREEDLERAVLNLVENALRFSPEGAPVSIRVAYDAEAEVLGVTVEDRGPGVPVENRGKIFERFFTTDADRDGTGLGLAIVRTVAHAHGGDVSLIDPDAPGARFEITLAAPAEGRGRAGRR
ncbi:MAG: HAMP domain-containing protein [Myxococcales bacterium]|nr:HAMP domain-containing protein [Myxococcales bacterium]